MAWQRAWALNSPPNSGNRHRSQPRLPLRNSVFAFDVLETRSVLAHDMIPGVAFELPNDWSATWWAEPRQLAFAIATHATSDSAAATTGNHAGCEQASGLIPAGWGNHNPPNGISLELGAGFGGNPSVGGDWDGAGECAGELPDELREPPASDPEDSHECSGDDEHFVGNSSEPSVSIVGEQRHDYSLWGFSGVELTNGFTATIDGGFVGSTSSENFRAYPPIVVVPETISLGVNGVPQSPGLGSSSFSSAPRANRVAADGNIAPGAFMVDRLGDAITREPEAYALSQQWSAERIGAEPRARVLPDCVPANQLEMPLWFSLIDSPLLTSRSSGEITDRVPHTGARPPQTDRDVATVELSREFWEEAAPIPPSATVAGEVWDLRVYTGTRDSETIAETSEREAPEWRLAGIGSDRAWLADTGTWGKWLSSVTSVVYALLQLSFRPRVSSERFEWQPPRRRPTPPRTPI